MDSESWSSSPQQMGYPPIDFRAELNEEQFAAVTAPDGPALVLAGAGSGKTRTLIYRVAYLLEQGVHPGNIMLLTFTNKAAREMLARVEDLTGVPRRAFWGGTFHSIGQRMLRMHGEPLGIHSNYTILDQSDAESLLADVIRGVDAFFLKDKNNPKAKVIANVISLSRNTCQSVEDSIKQFSPYFHEYIPDFEKFYEAYQTRKKQQQVADYDDLLVYWLEILKTQDQIAHYYQDRFQHILVDEYQDTNKIQAQIVDLIGSRNQIMAVGDDAQSIYSWRGANYKNILHFPDTHEGTEMYRIETNYRSTPEILGFANDIINQFDAGQGFHKVLRPVKEPHLQPMMIQAMDGREEASIVIRRIQALLEEGRSLSDITILYRAHYQAVDLQMELTRENVPFQITSGVQFFEQAHIKDLVAQIKFAYNSNDSRAFHRFTGLLPKVGEKTAEKIFQTAFQEAQTTGGHIASMFLTKKVVAKVPKGARDHWESLAATIQAVVKAASSETPSKIVAIAVEGWYSDYIKTLYPNYLQRMDDLQSLIGFAQRFTDLQELLSQLVLMNSETSRTSIDPDEDQLRLTTVHQAKGLEFPVVFILGCSDGFFPLKRAIDRGDLDEERRLFYVAVTRAMDELYMTSPRMTQFGGNTNIMDPSRFIQRVNPELYEVVRLKRYSSW
ncbi:MAG: ATP-dependent helicase [Verrucomicrobia bacterium]|nr:ATP-dependent helicase [Verrucomicrobiota bacterium]